MRPRFTFVFLGLVLWLIVGQASLQAQNLVYYSNPSYSVSSSGVWGQTITVKVSVLNTGQTASGAFTVKLYLSTAGGLNATSSEITYINFPALSYLSYAGGSFTVTLPRYIPAGLSSGPLYVVAVISQNGAQTASPCTISALAADLIGYNSGSYGFGIQQSSTAWGQTVGLKFAVANQSAGTASPFIAKVYLSESPNFGSGNAPASNVYFLENITFSSLPGGYISSSIDGSGNPGYGNLKLPSSNPFGDSATHFYVGMVVNPTGDSTYPPVTESNYSNNCNQGAGIDTSAVISIIPPQPQISVAGSNPAGSTSQLTFGNVNLGATSSQTVEISDLGPANLSLNSIGISGPFTITSVVSDIQTLAQPINYPALIQSNNREHWIVTVAYNASVVGNQTGSLTISSNDPTTPSVAYALQGTGVAVPHLVLGNPVPSNGANLIANFGSIADNSSETETFTLKNDGTAAIAFPANGIALTSGGVWSVVSVTSSSQGVINLASATNTIAPNSSETWSVLVKFAPTASQGYTTGLEVFSNDPTTIPGEPTLTCALQGVGVTPMSLSIASAVNGVVDPNPLIMNFGSLHATGLQKKTGTITLTNTGQLPLVIPQNGITLPSTNFLISGIISSTQGAISLASASATLAPNSGETWTINLTFNPTTSGSDNTTLTVLSNDPANGNESIALNGIGLNQPGIAVTTSSGTTTLPFGMVLNDGAGNHLGTQTFTIQNLGLQPLVISKNGLSLTNATGFTVASIISSTQGTISLSANSATITAKQAETWTVTGTFDPTTNSAYSGTLNIASNDPISPTIALSLSGTGTTPTLVLNPTTSSTPLLSIEAGAVYNITWTSSDTADTASTATLVLSTSPTNTLPATGLTTIATIPYNATTKSYPWQPSTSLIGQSVYLYGSLQDTGVSSNSYAAQKFTIDASNSFSLLSPITTTTSNYVYQYFYNGKAYGGLATLQPGNNIILITTTLPGGGTVVHQVVINQVSSLIATQGYTYDELNRIKTYTNGNGITTTYTYDLVGNLVQTSATNGNTVTYTYDTLKRRTSMTDSTGTTFYDFDDLDRVTAITYSTDNIRGNADDLVLTYQYDAGNRITGITYPGGEQVTYTYDNAGRMLTVQDVVNSTTTFSYSYIYSQTTGKLQQTNRANGVVTTYGYDSVGRINDIKHVNSSGALLAEYSYVIDVNGNALSLITTFSDGTQKQEVYGYDGQQRLTQVTYGGQNPAVVNSDKTVSYTYDSNGNRLTQTTTIANVVTQRLTYSYGTSNQLEQVVDQTGSVQDSYVYDSAGNRIEKITPQGNSYYSYDERNLLILVVTPSDCLQYQYDGITERAQRIVDGVSTRSIMDQTSDPFHSIQERNGTVVTSSIFGLEELQENVSGSSPVFYLSDRVGSIKVKTDSSGAIIHLVSYDIFGRAQ